MFALTSSVQEAMAAPAYTDLSAAFSDMQKQVPVFRVNNDSQSDTRLRMADRQGRRVEILPQTPGSGWVEMELYDEKSKFGVVKLWTNNEAKFSNYEVYIPIADISVKFIEATTQYPRPDQMAEFGRWKFHLGTFGFRFHDTTTNFEVWIKRDGMVGYFERDEAPRIKVSQFPGGISIRDTYYHKGGPFITRIEITDPAVADPYICVDPGPFDCDDIAHAFSTRKLKSLKDFKPQDFPAK